MSSWSTVRYKIVLHRVSIPDQKTGALRNVLWECGVRDCFPNKNEEFPIKNKKSGFFLYAIFCNGPMPDFFPTIPFVHLENFSHGKVAGYRCG
jgi:hypothetical protein